VIRSFVALLLDEAARGAVAEAIQRLRAVERGAGRAVAWVPAQNLHLTLKFLGEQPEPRLAEAQAALAPAAGACRPFTIALKGVGAFPTLERPRILWVGLTEGGAEARALQEQVEAALALRGFPRDERPWHPHLTIGRIPDDRRWRRDSGPALREAIAAIATLSFGRVAVDRLVLMGSELGPSGARYRELASAPLG
jgi:2'-5' RNA ligase